MARLVLIVSLWTSPAIDVFTPLLISLLAWVDTKIILDVADPNYINTLGKGEGVTGDMSTEDGGKTWTVSTINIPEFTF